VRTLLRLLSALASALDAFIDAGGVALLVDYLRERREEARANARRQHQAWVDGELGSGDPARVERVYVLLRDEAEANHHRAPGDPVGGPASGDGDNDARLPPTDDAALEALRRKAAEVMG